MDTVIRLPTDRPLHRLLVSWIRQRDLHILTTMMITYTGDERFHVVHPEQSEDWDLRVEYVQPRDQGIYECQVNTDPKISLAVTLNVKGKTAESVTELIANPRIGEDDLYSVQAAKATISGNPDVYVKKGSTISLTCSVDVHSTPPGSVTWYHGSSVVDFDSQRGGISLETERTEPRTTSKLLVTRAELSDTGNYTCVPSNANPASVFVHVLKGEHTGAIQRASNRAGSPSSWLPILSTAAAILIPTIMATISSSSCCVR